VKITDYSEDISPPSSGPKNKPQQENNVKADGKQRLCPEDRTIQIQFWF
jgi:hypothetical protein